MEEIDREILNLLAAEGRMSFTDIGKRTGLSTSAAQQRVRRLERRGVITGYRALVDADAVDRGITAFVQAEPLDHDGRLGEPKSLEGIDGIVSCWNTAGPASFLMRVQVPSTAALQEVLNRIRTEALMSTHTMLVLETVFEDRPLWSKSGDALTESPVDDSGAAVPHAEAQGTGRKKQRHKKENDKS
ncbi:Lrp/AsnC family transcriptional regulator [Propioniferax innocua]|uniref:AsnC family transcriptional regulator n=1 Tax=Propioniferax innocua TaxID=1753 RepID=A0A542ZQ17_9ACTN|nr:Lrp/AsnC family transcriptional regulator [Propioniferax innocua]TQL62366.1 AsnC family transcriptional regulator [Propioniferax innocua]